jgi:protein gp37
MGPPTNVDGEQVTAHAGGDERLKKYVDDNDDLHDTCSTWPLPSVWLGVSVENQDAADARIPDLLATPAAVRFLSVEPLLGPVDLNVAAWGKGLPRPPADIQVRQMATVNGMRLPLRALDWVIVGGESGPGARPMHPDWVRSLRDQCVAAGVPFFMKQWGGVRKKLRGRILDGRTWDEMPKVQP